MGVSTDAYICFGINLGENLSIPHPDNLEGEDDTLYQWEALEILEPKLVKYKLEVVPHCSEGHPMFVLGYEPSREWACRGYPETLNLKAMQKLEGKGKKAFKDFLDEEAELVRQLDLETDQPSWLLFSNWS
jgi:hypothetical protein